MNQSLVSGGAALLGAYNRHVPLTTGKRPLWNNLVQRLMAQGHGLDLETTTRFGARMHIRFPDAIQSFAYFFAAREPCVAAYLTQALAPGDIVIDIGANAGYDTLLASRLVGREGEVHAIEASASAYALLEENLALNDTMNATPYHAAIGPRGQALAAVIAEETIVSARLIRVEAEGAEFPVVLGFAELLPHLAAYTELLIDVSAEGLADHGVTAAEFLGLFRRAGFAPWTIGDHAGFDAYLAPAAGPRPLIGEQFDHLDILFRRE